jgi:hypothetical protein
VKIVKIRMEKTAPILGQQIDSARQLARKVY